MNAEGSYLFIGFVGLGLAGCVVWFLCLLLPLGGVKK